MTDADRAFVEALRRDEESGATAIVTRTARALAAGGRDRTALVEMADACRAAQPAMAGLLTIVKIARDAAAPEPALALMVERLLRAPASIARNAAELLLLGVAGRSVRLVTCSASAPVEATARLLATRVDVAICCAESRPRYEGTMLARRLADAGLDCRLFSDAGISAAIPGSDALVIGADAVGPDAFINKVGSAALCAWAATAGVPVYVLAGREKHLSAGEFSSLSFPERVVDQEPATPWPARLLVENPTFEHIPRHLVAQFISEAGSGTDMSAL